MDGKRNLSQEKDLCQNVDKRKKIATPENQRDGGSGRGSISGEGLANNLHLDENELVEVHVRSDQEINKSRDKGKVMFDLNESPTWPNEETLSNTFENNGHNLKDCEHSWIWKQGSGHVCWICGIIDKNHSVPPGFRSSNYKDIKLRVPEDGFSGTGIFPHRLHKSYMLSHHIEILNFLCNNLAVENPNGCILAQAPISEKTFLMISFIYGYLAKHPNSKPLFVLPKSMLHFWKKEFHGLQVNDVLLLDLYSAKANSPSQQLKVLIKWITNRSILLLGHRQFSNMVSDDSNGTEASTYCRDIILNVPSLVIFDRGADPRNEMMSFLNVVGRIKTPLKVLLTGTLYQNHIREVFNILDVVFPEFLKHNHIEKKIGKFLNVDDEADGLSMNLKMPLFDKLEESILCEDTDDHGGKIGYLTELRMLTNKVIYNHKGEFLLEVPRLMDFTVVVKPTLRQMERKSNGKGFKTYSTSSGITLHPALCAFSDRIKDLSAPNEDEMDEILKDIDVSDGVKTKFFLGLVKLCGYTNEKILVVSQYVSPLIFLQRLMAKINGWKDGEETFMIKGDTSISTQEISINQFNNSSHAKIFFASIKSCSEEITLTGATRIVMLDIIANPCMARQAVGLAYNPGQQNKVYSYRLVAADTSEEEEDIIAAKKEIVSGIWFDGNTYPLDGKFQIPTIDWDYCNDNYLGASYMKEDIKTIYKR